jgi:hypothetical protein
MRRHPFLPLASHEGKVTVPVADPFDLPGIDRIETLLGNPVVLVVATK